MPEITLTVRNKVGLHARPAALFVQAAQKYECEVKVTHGEREGNAKSILSVLSLGIDQNAVITIHTEGDNADQALETLEALIENNFGEK